MTSKNLPKMLPELLRDIRACTICSASLPCEPRPVLQVSSTAKILVVGQAPGRRVQESGIPFDDPSGDRLRLWMGVDRATFYDAAKIAIIPMGFCYPGTGKSGDLPPRSECAETWRKPLMQLVPQVELTLVIGQYAIGWHLPTKRKSTVTQAVQNWQHHWPEKIVLPHPSPRNNIWLKKNQWFEGELLPPLKERVSALLTDI